MNNPAPDLPMPTRTCLRCGYTWIPLKPAPPIRCANKKCRSLYWHTPRGTNKPGRKPWKNKETT